MPSKFNSAKNNLKEAFLVSENEVGDLDMHPLVRAWFAEQFANTSPDDFKNAHEILFQFLSRQEVPENPSLRDLEPIIRSVHHGCKSNHEQEALDKLFYEILLDGENEVFYLRDRLGAVTSNLYVASCFFDGEFEKPLECFDESDAAWLASEAAITFQMLGRIRDAKRLFLSNFERFKNLNQYDNVTVSLENAVDCMIVLGEYQEAEELARLSLGYCDKVDYFFRRVVALSRLAMVKCLRGSVEDGVKLFREAESVQKIGDGKPTLASVNAYYFNSVLLDAGEIESIPSRIATSMQHATSSFAEGLVLEAQARLLQMNGELDSSIGLINASVEAIRDGQRMDFLPRTLIWRGRILLDLFESGSRSNPWLELCEQSLNEASEIIRLGEMSHAKVDLHNTWAAFYGLAREMGKQKKHSDFANRLADSIGLRARQKG